MTTRLRVKVTDNNASADTKMLYLIIRPTRDKTKVLNNFEMALVVYERYFTVD